MEYPPLTVSQYALRLTQEQIGLSDLNQPTPYLQLSPAQLYSALPVGENRTIRLLDLDDLPLQSRRSKSDETPLSGTLRVVSLSTKPRFTALSYVWGDHSTRHAGTLKLRHSGGHGVELKISTSCQDALRSLRSMYGSLCIWIDAVCINQDDEAERSSQVKLMEDIYSWATDVYAWLGPGTDASGRAMDWIRQVAKRDFLDTASATFPPTPRNQALYNSSATYRMVVYFLLVVKDTWLEWIMLPILPTLELLNAKLSPYHPSKLFTADSHHPDLELNDLRDILAREWFRRIWTFQELVLSPNVTLICGHDRLKWTQVVIALRVSKALNYNCGPRKYLGQLGNPSPVTDILLQPMLNLIDVWMNTERPMRWERTSGPEELQHITYVSWLQGLVKGNFLVTLARIIAMIAYASQTTLWVDLSVALLSGLSDQELSKRIIVIIVGTIIHVMLLLCYFPSRGRIGLRYQINRKVSTYLTISVLSTIRKRQATDDRDHSYAIYGILQRLGIENLSRPDYSKPVDRVYQELTRDLLQWSSMTLNFVLHASIGSNTGGPSWVPNWSIGAEKQWIRQDYIVDPVGPGYVGFRGSDGLIVQGIQHGSVNFSSGPICEINTFGASSPSPVDISATTLQFLRWVMHLDKQVTLYPAYDYIPLIIERVLNAEIDSKAGIHLETEDLFAWYSALVESGAVYPEAYSTELESYGPYIEQLKDITERTYNCSRGGSIARELTIKICNHIAGRRNLFTTTNGLAGSGPEAMISGDVVMLISGVSVPMILRPVMYDSSEASDDLAYRIIGPAFVYGAMMQDFEEYGEKITLV